MECLGLYNKPKAVVNPEHKLTVPKKKKKKKKTSSLLRGRLLHACSISVLLKSKNGKAQDFQHGIYHPLADQKQAYKIRCTSSGSTGNTGATGMP